MSDLSSIRKDDVCHRYALGVILNQDATRAVI